MARDRLNATRPLAKRHYHLRSSCSFQAKQPLAESGRQDEGTNPEWMLGLPFVLEGERYPRAVGNHLAILDFDIHVSHFGDA
jgi:hypothetical protein